MLIASMSVLNVAGALELGSALLAHSPAQLGSLAPQQASVLGVLLALVLAWLLAHVVKLVIVIIIIYLLAILLAWGLGMTRWLRPRAVPPIAWLSAWAVTTVASFFVAPITWLALLAGFLVLPLLLKVPLILIAILLGVWMISSCAKLQRN